MDEIRAVVAEGGIEPFIRVIEQEGTGDLTTLEIAAALMKMQIEHGEEREKSMPRQTSGIPGPKRPGWSGSFWASAATTGSPRKISWGYRKRDRHPGKVHRRIRILDTYSFVEIPRDCAEEVYTV